MGIAFIIGASSVMGMLVAENFVSRPRQLRVLQAGLKILNTEISYGRTPLPAAFSLVARQIDQPISGLFEETARLLKSTVGYTAGEAWRETLEKLFESTCLGTEDKEILINFGHGLGVSDYEDQQKIITHVSVQLAEAERKAEEVRRKNERVWRHGGFLVGTLIALLLL